MPPRSHGNFSPCQRLTQNCVRELSNSSSVMEVLNSLDPPVCHLASACARRRLWPAGNGCRLMRRRTPSCLLARGPLRVIQFYRFSSRAIPARSTVPAFCTLKNSHAAQSLSGVHSKLKRFYSVSTSRSCAAKNSRGSSSCRKPTQMGVSMGLRTQPVTTYVDPCL